MRTSSLIGHVLEVYSEFRERPEVPADAVIRRFFLARKYLGSTDRRYIADTYFGIIKNWRRLEALCEDCFQGVESSLAHHAAAYLVAVQGQSAEEGMESFEGLPMKNPIDIGAFQCLADRERENARLAALPQDERLAILFSYPTWFVSRLRDEYGDATAEKMLATLNGEAPTTLRANTLATDRTALQATLASEGCEVAFSKIAADALILPKRVNVFTLQSFRRGEFEVQDEASQLVAPLANIHKTAIKALDACAGAGGKTLHLSALMKNRGEIFASDVDDRKLEELRERSKRNGAQNIRIVRNAEKLKLLGEDKASWFDLVLLDVPCTGTGTVRRNPGIKWLLTEQMLAELVAKQRLILEENIGFVKQGGALLYATCSVLKEEGEDQITWLTATHPEFQLEQTIRTQPEIDGCDGFFAARLRKVSATPAV